MRLKFWGTRGSLASPGPDRVRYGGNTLCLSATTDQGALILDAGTGLPALGADLLARERPPTEHHLLLTHFHWDHVLGLPFFTPLYLPEHRVHLYGSDAAKLEQTLYRLFHARYSPIKGTENLAAELVYHSVPLAGMDIAGVRVTPRQVLHTSPSVTTLAFRLQHQGRSVVYCTDHEAGVDSLVDQGITLLSAGADALIHDTAFTPETYPEHQGWGHSSWAEALRLAVEARVKRLVLFHYNPDHSDSDIETLLADCRAAAPDAIEVIASSDGMVLDL